MLLLGCEKMPSAALKILLFQAHLAAHSLIPGSFSRPKFDTALPIKIYTTSLIKVYIDGKCLLLYFWKTVLESMGPNFYGLAVYSRFIYCSYSKTSWLKVSSIFLGFLDVTKQYLKISKIVLKKWLENAYPSTK